MWEGKRSGETERRETDRKGGRGDARYMPQHTSSTDWKRREMCLIQQAFSGSVCVCGGL